MLLVAAVCGVIALLVNALVHSAPQIAESLQQSGSRLAEWLGPTGEKIRHALDNAKGETNSLVSTITNGVLSGLGLATQLIAGGVLALALVFFFLRDGHRTGDTIRSYLPERSAETVTACAERAFDAMAGFMRGTTLIALIDATFITIGLVALGVPGAPGLGALVFMGAYIPFVGAFLSGAVSVLVALADGGLGTAAWALAVVMAVQLIEGNVLQPSSRAGRWSCTRPPSWSPWWPLRDRRHPRGPARRAGLRCRGGHRLRPARRPRPACRPPCGQRR